MNGILDYAYRVSFTKFALGLSGQQAFAVSPDDIGHIIDRPNLLIMSCLTEREIMRADFNNSSGILTAQDKTTPRRVFGLRIAYDDTLADGVIIPALMGAEK